MKSGGIIRRMQANQNESRIMGKSVRGAVRRVLLTRGQPGFIAINIYVRDKPVTAVVQAAELRADLAGLAKW